MRSSCVFDSPRLSLPLLAVHFTSYHLFHLLCLQLLLPTMWWTNTLRTSADEDLGTLAEYDPLTRIQGIT